MCNFLLILTFVPLYGHTNGPLMCKRLDILDSDPQSSSHESNYCKLIYLKQFQAWPLSVTFYDELSECCILHCQGPLNDKLECI